MLGKRAVQGAGGRYRGRGGWKAGPGRVAVPARKRDCSGHCEESANVQAACMNHISALESKRGVQSNVRRLGGSPKGGAIVAAAAATTAASARQVHTMQCSWNEVAVAETPLRLVDMLLANLVRMLCRHGTYQPLRQRPCKGASAPGEGAHLPVAATATGAGWSCWFVPPVLRMISVFRQHVIMSYSIPAGQLPAFHIHSHIAQGRARVQAQQPRQKCTHELTGALWPFPSRSAACQSCSS